MQGASVITGIISALLGIASAMAGLTLARLGDRHNKISLIAIFLGVGTVLSLPIYFMRNIAGFTLFYVLVALALGGVEPNLQSFLSEHTRPSRRGLLFGIQTFVGSLGWFAAPLVGSVISIRLSIRHIFLFFSAAILLAFLFDFFVLASKKSVNRVRSESRAAS